MSPHPQQHETGSDRVDAYWTRSRRFVKVAAVPLVLVAVLVAMSGVAGLHVPPFPGLLQKLLAGLSFLPATAIAAVAIRR